MTPVRLLYLDVDGVLKPANRHDGGSRLSDANVAALNGLADVPGLRLVVSSTWRRSSDCRDQLASQGVAIPFFDASWRTPDDDDDDRSGQVARHLSQGWRSSHRVDAIALVDDLFGPMPGWMAAHLVATDPDVGLSDGDARSLRRILAIPAPASA